MLKTVKTDFFNQLNQRNMKKDTYRETKLGLELGLDCVMFGIYGWDQWKLKPFNFLIGFRILFFDIYFYSYLFEKDKIAV